MKVALIVPGFSAHERDWCIPALLNYVRVLAQQAEVHVFTLRWPEHGRTYPVFGATVHALNGREHLGARAFGLWGRALRAITFQHRRTPFEVLHAFWADEPGWVAALASRWLKVRAILSLAGGELVGRREIGYGLQLLPGRRALIRAALRQAKYVTAGSDYLCTLARAYCDPRKLVRVPLGVDTAFFSPLYPSTAARVLRLRPSGFAHAKRARASPVKRPLRSGFGDLRGRDGARDAFSLILRRVFRNRAGDRRTLIHRRADSLSGAEGLAAHADMRQQSTIVQHPPLAR
jgi:hypothetical protein